MSGKKNKKSAILVNPLKLKISLSSLDIIHEIWDRMRIQDRVQQQS